MTCIPHYEQRTVGLSEQYDSLSFQDVHASLLDRAAPDATTFYIGTGSGRDNALLENTGPFYTQCPINVFISSSSSTREAPHVAKRRCLHDAVPAPI